LSYSEALQSVVRTRPHLDCRLKRCLHCGIFFFTESSNVKRDDLRCPFGCAVSHRRANSIRRSVEYYRTDKGRALKHALNRRRCLFSTVASRALASAEAAEEAPVEAFDGASSAAMDGERVSASAERERTAATILSLDMSSPIIKHIRMVTSMIEGRVVSVEEVALMLRKVLRQHRIIKRRRFDYTVEELNKGPP